MERLEQAKIDPIENGFGFYWLTGDEAALLVTITDMAQRHTSINGEISIAHAASKGDTFTITSNNRITLTNAKSRSDIVRSIREKCDGDHYYYRWEQVIDQVCSLAIEAYRSENGKRFNWHDHAIKHTDLLNKDLKPLDFMVEDTFISAGTGVIAGRKKAHKSFMGTQLSASIASGGLFLGKKVMKRGKVVHMALEDGERRTQSRLKMQGIPAGLDITYFYTWPCLNTDDGLKQFKDMLSELQPNFVVIDTLAKVLSGRADQNSAGEMAEFGNLIHDIALQNDCFILFIAHHGKGLQINTRDPGFDIRGSSAIPGSTDINIGLYRNEDGTYDLMGEGRDIPEFEMRIKFDKELTWCWQFEGEAQDVRRIQAEKSIIDAMVTLGGENIEVQHIADEAELSRSNVQTHLKRMRDYEIPLVEFKVGKFNKILYSLTSLTSLTTTHHTHHQHPINNGVTGVNEMSQAQLGTGVNDVNDVSITLNAETSDCPRCQRNEWAVNDTGHLVCPCGFVDERQKI